MRCSVSRSSSDIGGSRIRANAQHRGTHSISCRHSSRFCLEPRSSRTPHGLRHNIDKHYEAQAKQTRALRDDIGA